MKAADILMWLLIFNLVLWLLGGYGLNLYNLHAYTPGINVGALNGSAPTTGTLGIDSRALAFLSDVGGVAFLAFIGILVSTALTGYFKVPLSTPQGAVYGAFSGLFWGSYIKTTQVFYDIFAFFKISATVKITLFSSVFLIFTGICAFVFIFGLMQMVTGGWRFFK